MESMYREQALANCRFLYGPTTEIITLQTESEGFQAFAIQFDRREETSTVHLCSSSKPDGSSDQVNATVAIRRLCKRSGIEIRNCLSADGVDVPFSKDGTPHNSLRVLHMPRHHNKLVELKIAREDISEGSESSFADTPTSSIAGTETADDVMAEATHDDQCSIEESPTIGKDEIDNSRGTKLEAQSKPAVMANTIVQEALPQAVVQHDQIDDLSSKVVAAIESQLKKVFADFKIELTTQMIEVLDEKLGSVFNRKDEAHAGNNPSVEISATTKQPEYDDNWMKLWGMKKKGTETDTKNTLPVIQEDIQGSLSKSIPSEPESVLLPAADSEVVWEQVAEEDDSSPSTTKTENRKGLKPDFEISLPEPEAIPEPIAEQDIWAPLTSKKDKKKKGKKTVDFFEDPLPQPEVIPEPIVEDDTWSSFSSKKDKKKKGKKVVIDGPEPEPEAEPIPVEDGWGSFTKDRKKNKAAVTELIIEPEPEPGIIPDPEPEAFDDFWWGSFATKKEKKKKKSAAADCVVEPEPAQVAEPQSIPYPEPAAVDDFGWGSFGSKKDKKKKGKVTVSVLESIAEPDLSADPEPKAVDDDFSWGSFGTKKDKKEKEKVVTEPAPEPSPPPEEIEDLWYFGSKKSKKSKNVKSVDLVPEEPAIPADPVPEAVDDWGFSASKKDKKKSRYTFDAVVEELVTVPPSLPGSEVTDNIFDWDSFTQSGKSKKKKVEQVPTDIPLSEQEELEKSSAATEPEAASEDPWAGWVTGTAKSQTENTTTVDSPMAHQEELKDSSTSQAPEVNMEDPWYFPPPKSKKKGKKVVIELPPSEQEELEKSVQGGDISNSSCSNNQTVVVSDDIQGINPSNSEVFDALSEEQSPSNTTTTPTVKQPNPDDTRSPGGMAVVLKILCRDSSGMVVVERSMMKLQENTKQGIDEAARSICLKLGLSASAGLLKFEIVSGVGKDGDLALEDLDDAMWPEYLEYFRICTKIPELTLESMGFEADFSNLMIDD